MGRHSIPDPEDSSGGAPEGAGDATESNEAQPASPYDEPDYQGGPASGYRGPERQSGVETDYDTDYSDYEADYPEAGYRPPLHSDVPEYLTPGHREHDSADDEFGRSADDGSAYDADAPPDDAAARATLRRMGGRRVDG